MEQTNPYAPPAVAETHAEDARRWHVDGIGVLVKHGAVLPKVDLESGVSGDDLTCVPRAFQGVGPVGLFQLLVVVAIGTAAQVYFKFGIWFILSICLAFSFLSRFGFFAGLNVPKQTIWIFEEPKRIRARRRRNWLRGGAMILIFVSMLASLLIPVLLMRPEPEFFPKWLMWVVAPGALAILGIGVWGVVDRPKTSISSTANGWLRISPVHPEALVFLRENEPAVETPPVETPIDTPRTRLVRSVFLHRYPLRALVGTSRNPWNILYVALLKVLRSRLLIREAWHFSEASDISRAELCEPLRQAVDDWHAKHPDWILARMTHDTSPAGDLVTELAWFASCDFRHGVLLGRSWFVQVPHPHVSVQFYTWLADQKAFTTCAQPPMTLSDPELHQRASGTPEQMLEAHLRGVSPYTSSPPADLQGFLERIHQYFEQVDRLLIEQGYQSEVREVSV